MPQDVPTEKHQGAITPDHFDAPDATCTIDVSNLPPPEPMVRILEALEHLEPGETLRVEHVRRPIYLYPRLDRLGYLHQTRELAGGRVQLLIQKPSPTDPRS